MFNQSLEEPPQLESAINAGDYIDGMSAPRVDPTRPEMTGWAMKLRRRSSNAAGGTEQRQGGAGLSVNSELE
jgi:sulfite reductase (NADPH) hemoprotein beta-component